MEWKIIMTWSKIVAVLILGCAVYLDLQNEGMQAFVISLPFIAALIIGKQAFDKNKT